MYIKSLRLSHYRNYQELQVSFQPNINVIVGKNAQGKTNLIEALYYLSLCRSFRTSQDQALIQNGEEYADLVCWLKEEKQESYLRCILHEKGKSLFIGKTNVSKTSEFIGRLNVVLFSPEDIYIFSQAPRARRKFMDQELMKLSKKYLFHLTRYNTLLKERNVLLKKASIDETMLDILDKQMVTSEVEILKRRSSFLKFINQEIERLFQSLSGMKLRLQVVMNNGIEVDKIDEEILLKAHLFSRQKDIEYHITNVGIHRGDIQFRLADNDILLSASQGQKRLVMIAFKLAILHYIEFISKRKAVVLLDDVLSELDLERQKRLLDAVKNGYQCFITTTYLPDSLKLEKLNCISIQDGKVKI
ncbi:MULTISPECIES: DNA replication/repair protein RecF [Terrabacteria group]|uniref:DNA replication/repair protein RecF n=1 Tax=Bacillati TaxID=1783272 RepID=UPI001C6E18A0|nr:MULTISPECIES: DNA replication/repair protein RecF [Terrabacteria group]MBW9212501.1 DNA replication/repair protein RecF [Trueperella sp. zg.1013]